MIKEEKPIRSFVSGVMLGAAIGFGTGAYLFARSSNPPTNADETTRFDDR